MPVFVNTFLSKQTLVFDEENVFTSGIKRFIHRKTKIPREILQISHQGKRVSDNILIPNGSFISVYLQLPGGKGGFGSMLRAIGAQIEKTTNREACRDLSGRRLRDINEEKRLKHWLAKQKEREAEANQKKQEKLVKITQEPKHKFHDPDYDKFRSELTERISSAVEEGLKKSIQIEQSSKRKAPEVDVPAKKPRMWLGFDEDLDDSGTSSEEETENKLTKSSEGPHKLENVPELLLKEEENNLKDSDETPLDLNQYQNVKDLENKLGNEGIAAILKDLGLKTGGNEKERAERLWGVITGKKDKINTEKLTSKCDSERPESK